MIYVFKKLRIWKSLSNVHKELLIKDIVRNILLIGLGILLYLLLNNTGLLIYIIFMLKYHWYLES